MMISVNLLKCHVVIIIALSAGHNILRVRLRKELVKTLHVQDVVYQYQWYVAASLP